MPFAWQQLRGSFAKRRRLVLFCSHAHGLSAGQTVVVEGATPAAYDGAFTVASVIDDTHFTYALAATPASNASGSNMTAAAQSLDQVVSRPDGLQDGATLGAATAGTVLEAYAYLGSNTIVRAAHPQTGIDQTSIAQDGDTAAPPAYAATGGDRYTGLDQFGRTDDVFYVNPASVTSPTDRFQYAYDRDSNPLYKDVVGQGAAGAAWSQLYHASGGGDDAAYDGLNRLTAFSRGALSASGVNNPAGVLDTVASPASAQSWSLDALGNWSAFAASPGPSLARSFNAQNQITANSGSTTPTYDANGNVTTDPSGNALTYDAWNRLVGDGNSVAPYARYQYLPGGPRAATTSCSTSSDTRFSYFSTDWQDLEDDLPPAGGGTAPAPTTYAWGRENVNELVARDDASGVRLYAQHDANFDVTALVNPSGAVVQRFGYDPYGKATALGPTTWAGTPDAYAWAYRWQGGHYDATTGLYDFQRRDYGPSLGTWLENDPSGYAAGPNAYQAMLGAPIGRTDPHGLDPTPPAPASGSEGGTGATQVSTDPEIRRLIDLLGDDSPHVRDKARDDLLDYLITHPGAASTINPGNLDVGQGETAPRLNQVLSDLHNTTMLAAQNGLLYAVGVLNDVSTAVQDFANDNEIPQNFVQPVINALNGTAQAASLAAYTVSIMH